MTIFGHDNVPARKLDLRYTMQGSAMAYTKPQKAPTNLWEKRRKLAVS